MKEFIITTDSTVDLPKSLLEEWQVPVISLSYTLDGTTYEDLSGLTSKELMDAIRNGAMPTTSQVNPEQARAAFEPFIREGKDILHIAFSSGLSGTCNSAKIAAEELMEENEDAKIIVIDSLCASMGEGLLLYKALELKKQGKNIDELAEWLEINKMHLCHDFTVDDLNHLYRGGRVSKATAVLGTMINIKPILHVDMEGHLVAVGKARGRKKSMLYMVDRMAEKSKGFENDVAMIVHGDCEEDAAFLEKQLRERFGIQKIIINGIGAVIGSHTGPGVIAIFYMGNRE